MEMMAQQMQQQTRASPNQMRAPNNAGGIQPGMMGQGGAYGVIGKNNVVMNGELANNQHFVEQAKFATAPNGGMSHPGGNGFSAPQQMHQGVSNGGGQDYFNPHYPPSFYGQ